MTPILIIALATVFFFVLERILPGRELPEAPGWFARAAFMNGCQLGIVVLAGLGWNRWMQHWSLFHIASSMPPFAQGLLSWFIGTFVFYWWHRARHDREHRRKQAHGSTSLPCLASISTTATFVLHTGWVTSCSARSIIQSTMNSMFTASTTAT